jgi:hypothetical protein
MKPAGGEPLPEDSRRNAFAKVVALNGHRFHFGAASSAPGHDGFTPAYHQQAFGLYRDPCRFHHRGTLRSLHRYSSDFDCSHPVRTQTKKSSMRSSILLRESQEVLWQWMQGLRAD